jgi:uncharacterized protein YjbI with pentapeptide repeats
MKNASLIGALMVETDLTNADLRGVDLSNARLTGAKYVDEQINLLAKSLKGARMTDGTTHL